MGFPREICAKPLNELVIFDDVPFFWDNWDICHHSLDTEVKKPQNNKLLTHSMLTGPGTFRASFTFEISEKSTITQVITFYTDSPRVDFVTTVDWFESRKFMKALFPLNVRSDYATFECGSGLLRRPIHTNTEWDRARYEVCAHRFCDISEAKFGVAILNDCKFGYSVRD